MRRAVLVTAAIYGLLYTTAAHAFAFAPKAPAQFNQRAFIDGSTQLDFVSAFNEQSYRLKISFPKEPPPLGGYPVLYVLDGDKFFGTFTEALRRGREQGFSITPTVIVAICYPDYWQGAGPRRRAYDFTPSRSEGFHPVGGEAWEYGGQPIFTKVLEQEIEPKVESLVTIDRHRKSVFGHSLGGLFVLETLFRQPDAFAAFVAISPSIWWNRRDVLQRAFRAAPSSAHPRVFIGVGGAEETLPPGASPRGLTSDQFAAQLAEQRMVGNAEDLAARLAQPDRLGRSSVEYRTFAGERHITVPWAAVNTVVDFIAGAPAGSP